MLLVVLLVVLLVGSGSPGSVCCLLFGVVACCVFPALTALEGVGKNGVRQKTENGAEDNACPETAKESQRKTSLIVCVSARACVEQRTDWKERVPVL